MEQESAKKKKKVKSNKNKKGSVRKLKSLGNDLYFFIFLNDFFLK